MALTLFEKKLEFRGIALQQIQLYLKELGGNGLSDHFPIHFQGENWSASILSEEKISLRQYLK